MRRGGPGSLTSRPSMSTTVSARADAAASSSSTAASSAARVALPRIGAGRDEGARQLGVGREVQVHVAQERAVDQIGLGAATVVLPDARNPLRHDVERRVMKLVTSRAGPGRAA